MILERLMALADIRDDSMPDIALMTDRGAEQWRSETASSCCNGQSTTKLLTAVCVAMLAEAGALRYQDKLTDILRDALPGGMDERWRAVTVHHALTHTMGIDAGIDIEGDTLPDGGNTDYAALAFRLPLVHEPGAHYQYTDIAYYLLSRAVERACGQTMEQFIRLRLGRPLGFRDFAIASCPLGHTFGGGCSYMRASDMVKVGYLLSCGGVYGEHRLLSQESVRLMIEQGYALHRFGETSLLLKTGAYGQCIAFSDAHRFAAAWHRTAYAVKPVPDRNDTMLAILARTEKEFFG